MNAARSNAPNKKREKEINQNFPQRVTIFGVGLIGGSLALALKRAFPEIRIAGADKPDVLDRARRLKIIDDALGSPFNPSDQLNSDLVVLATPVGDILRLLDQFTQNHRLVLDVGSTKLTICRKAERLGVPFIGGHPMAGLEQSGPEAASADLFNEAPFFLCPVQSTPIGAVEEIQTMARAIHAVPHIISPEEHDRLVAQISHLPQIISTLLADQTAAQKEFAGPGLRSMTRLAGSPFHIWRGIFKTSGALPQELQAFIERLQRILDSIEGGNFDEIEALFKRGGSA
jgi:prephenate dehydrogenase